MDGHPELGCISCLILGSECWEWVQRMEQLMQCNEVRRPLSGQYATTHQRYTLTQNSWTVKPGDPGQLHRDVVHQHLLFTHRDVQVDLQEEDGTEESTLSWVNDQKHPRQNEIGGCTWRLLESCSWVSARVPAVTLIRMFSCEHT